MRNIRIDTYKNILKLYRKSQSLANALDDLYADRVSDVFKQTIVNYSRSVDEDEIQAQLDAWAQAGFIQVIKPLSECHEMDKCIKLLAWIQPKKPN